MTRPDSTVTPKSLRALADRHAASEGYQTHHAEAFRAAADLIEWLQSPGNVPLTEPTQTAPTPPATSADINMLWAVIDELRGRIDALEGVKP